MSAEDIEMDDADGADQEAAAEADREDLQARIDLLEEENERLRAQYARARRATYRRSALALAVLGLLAAAGAWAFPAARDVLAILGAIGLFGAVLTYYLTPERFIAADVAERVYDALATTERDLVADLGLADERVYLPAGDDTTLFIPQHADDPLPAVEAIEGPLVVTDDARGLAVTPTGARLFTEFDRTLSGPLADTPVALVEQVTDTLVEGFELVDGTDVELDADDGRVTVALRGSTYPDAFDTPPASLLAVGLAVGLDTPVRVETAPADEADFTITCRWEGVD